MKGGKRRTFISQIFRDQELKPSPGPGSHSPSSRYTKKRSCLGIVNKCDRGAFTSDAEYLGSVSPGPVYIDPLKKSLPKPFKYTLKQKSHPWKAEKVDGPDPQSYPNQEKAFKELTSKSSPQWKQTKGKRVFFTDEMQKKGQTCPGAGKYEIIDYNKIHRKITSKRH